MFLAHAREDKERVRAPYKQIKQRGFNPWLDEEDLISGQIWETEIQKAIREAGAFIACLSQISVQKQGFVQTEFRLALTAYGEKPPGAIYFIPVRLDECEIPDVQIPNRGLSIRDFHWLDLWQEGGFERLIRALEKGLGTSGRAILKPGTVIRDIEEREITRDQVLIFYSHYDVRWMIRLKTVLAPITRNNSINIGRIL